MTIPNFRQMTQKEVAAYMEEPVTFIFRNSTRPGQSHEYIKNGQIVKLRHGEKYTLPRKYVEPLKTLFPDFKVEGDVDEGRTITRSDSPRFFAEPAEPDPSPIAEKIAEQKAKKVALEVLGEEEKPKEKKSQKVEAVNDVA